MGMGMGCLTEVGRRWVEGGETVPSRNSVNLRGFRGGIAEDFRCWGSRWGEGYWGRAEGCGMMAAGQKEKACPQIAQISADFWSFNRSGVEGGSKEERPFLRVTA
jgi:hypothetical protein